MGQVQRIGPPPRHLLHDERVIEHCERVAQPIEARAKGIAAELYETGGYERSIHIERHRGPTRTTVRVVADDPKASILESIHHVIGRSIG